MREVLRKYRAVRLLACLPILTVLAYSYGSLAPIEADVLRFVVWGTAGISAYIMLLRIFGYDPRRFSALEQYRWPGREGPGPRSRQAGAVLSLLLLCSVTAAALDGSHFTAAFFGVMFGAFIYEGISLAVGAYGPLSY